MITFHKSYLPSFGFTTPDQSPMCIYTVLSINEAVGDCAAYQGIGPTREPPYLDDVLEKVRSGGQKIREKEAREYFDEIETMKLRYRR